MTERQISLVQEVWKEIRSNTVDLDAILHGQLQELSLTKVEVVTEEELTTYLSAVFNGLEKVEEMVLLSQGLKEYLEEHYEMDTSHFHQWGVSFLEWIKDKVGEDWNEELNEAWSRAIGLTVDAMIKFGKY